MGKLTVITGGMFAGKSSELITKGDRHRIANHNVAYFKPVTDTRGKDTIRTHSGHAVDAYSVNSTEDLITLIEVNQYDVVLIDEVQFFKWSTMATLKLITHLTMGKDYTVYIAGLDMDFRGVPFSVTTDLMGLADEVIKVHAVCDDCGKDASHSFRFSGTKEVVQIGDDDSYKPLCRECYVKAVKSEGGN